MPRVENWTAAYKLTPEEARDIAVSYVLNNYLTLEKPVAFGKDGAPTYPKIGERSKLKLDNIGGVRFVADSQAAASWTMTGLMDLRSGAGRPAENIPRGSKANGASRRSIGVAWASAATRTTATARAWRSISMAR